MIKYIAGFNSNNSKKRKMIIIYYLLIIALFIMAPSRKLHDIALLLLLLMTPSILSNFINFMKKIKDANKRKIFLETLVAYVFVFGIFLFSTPNLDEIKSNTKENISYTKQTIKDNDLVSDALSKYRKISSKIDKNLVIKKGKKYIENRYKQNSLQKDNYQESNQNNNYENESNNIVNSNFKEAQLHFINTGNSDAILIRQNGEAMLIDGGDNDDETYLVNYLRDIGVYKLKYVVATHPDADHIGGLDAVINQIPVENVYVSNGDADTKTYRDFIEAMANKNLHPSVPLIGSEFSLGTSKFKVLSAANLRDPNNNSIVLEYTNGYDKILLMGDAGQEIERLINVDKVDLIKIGHHGSKTSSNPKFIKKVNPKYAVITVGANNIYHHPDRETMETLANENIEVHRTDECGNILVKSSGQGLIINCKEGSYNYGN